MQANKRKLYTKLYILVIASVIATVSILVDTSVVYADASTDGGNWSQEYEDWFDALEEASRIEHDQEPVTEIEYQTEPQTEHRPASQTEKDDQADMDRIAQSLSTTEIALAMEFEWLHDVIDFDGTGAGQVVDDDHIRLIYGAENRLLNGGWKAYMYDADGATSRYLNAEINTYDNVFDVTLNWKYVFMDSTSYDEPGSSKFKGSWDPVEGEAYAASVSGNIDFWACCISYDNRYEYVLGTFTWPSGEKSYIGLMR